MDDLVNDVIIYMIDTYFDIHSILSFLRTSKNYLSFKNNHQIKTRIIKNTLGDQGIELINTIKQLDPSTKNLLIPTVPIMTLKLLKLLTILQIDVKRCMSANIYRKSLGKYLNETNFHIVLIAPDILEGQHIRNVKTILIYNCHAGFSSHRIQIIHKANHLSNNGKINCIEIGDKGDDRIRFSELLTN